MEMSGLLRLKLRRVQRYDVLRYSVKSDKVLPPEDLMVLREDRGVSLKAIYV